VIHGHRTRDVVFRDLRNEELSQYKSLFNLAQTYVYCAAKAYDYETGLLGSPQGSAYMSEILATYSLGAFSGGSPVRGTLGDPGLAGILSDLRDDWAIVEGRLGFNNPDRNGTVFSLRQELFRIPTDQPSANDNILWKQVLSQNVMSNVMNDPDVALYCNRIAKADGSAVPGIVIPFSTTIQAGLNFFGWPLAAGDHAFSQSTFATRLHRHGSVCSRHTGHKRASQLKSECDKRDAVCLSHSSRGGYDACSRARRSKYASFLGRARPSSSPTKKYGCGGIFRRPNLHCQRDIERKTLDHPETPSLPRCG
jgi:hypothetical protein